LKVYTANRLETGITVYVNGQLLYIEPSQAIHDHAPEFEWAYGGSGPSQLALAILYDYTDDKDLSLEHYEQFKWDFLAVAAFDGFVITSMDIDAWLADKKREGHE
jgi:hypothetical protein